MDTGEDQFQEEVLKLFAEEGLEWLDQIKTSLDTLENNPPAGQIDRLYDAILRSLTNLMGSAATVDLSALQQLALAMIPLLQAMQGKKVAATPEHFAIIRQGLALLGSGVQVLNMAESKTTVIPNLEGIMQRQAEHLQRTIGKLPGLAQPGKNGGKPAESSAHHTLAAIAPVMLELNHSHPSALEPTRNLTEIVLRKLHRLLDQDAVAVTASSVLSILNQTKSLDERFLEETRRRTDSIKTVLAGMHAGKSDPAEQKRNLQNALREVSCLLELAVEADAGAIVQVLHGLETLLLAVAYKNTSVDPKRTDAVIARVNALTTMAQQWVEKSQAERAAIEKTLAPLLDTNHPPK